MSLSEKMIIMKYNWIQAMMLWQRYDHFDIVAGKVSLITGLVYPLVPVLVNLICQNDHFSFLEAQFTDILRFEVVQTLAGWAALLGRFGGWSRRCAGQGRHQRWGVVDGRCRMHRRVLRRTDTVQAKLLSRSFHIRL